VIHDILSAMLLSPAARSSVWRSVVAAGVVVAIFALRPADPQGSLGTINGRMP